MLAMTKVFFWICRRQLVQESVIDFLVSHHQLPEPDTERVQALADISRSALLS